MKNLLFICSIIFTFQTFTSCKKEVIIQPKEKLSISKEESVNNTDRKSTNSKYKNCSFYYLKTIRYDHGPSYNISFTAKPNWYLKQEISNNDGWRAYYKVLYKLKILDQDNNIVGKVRYPKYDSDYLLSGVTTPIGSELTTSIGYFVNTNLKYGEKYTLIFTSSAYKVDKITGAWTTIYKDRKRSSSIIRK